jgi:RalA-binding protein 1
LESLHSSDILPPSDTPPSPDGVNQGASRVEMPTKVKISGPMNGTPIPLGHKFGGKEPPTEAVQSDRRDKVKSRMFQWGWRQHGGERLMADQPINVHVISTVQRNPLPLHNPTFTARCLA